MTQATATDTRVAIIEAALKCFQVKGMNKTTVVDITRAADVSRSTVYEYFSDKAAIVEACAEHVSQLFFREMALAMDGATTLEDKLARAAVVVTKARQLIEPEKYFDADEVSLLLTRNAAALLRQSGEFLTPYLTAAKLTGEVRRDLDIESAAEWFSRMLFSLFTTPSGRLDTSDAQAVATFVHEHAVRGFTGQSPSRRPRR